MNNNNKCRVALIAGLNDGRMVYEYLQSRSDLLELCGVFAVEDTADSLVSGFIDFKSFVNSDLLFLFQSLDDCEPSIRTLQPDVIIVVGISQLVSNQILSIPLYGVVGFHSAVLPGRRGCSPIIWAIIDGLNETGVTMFFMDESIDSGDIIDTEIITIEQNDESVDVLRKADQATLELVKKNLNSIIHNQAPRTTHDLQQSIYTRKRTAADGEIDWNECSSKIVNKVRALAKPYPCAHTFGGDGVPILIEKARIGRIEDLPKPTFSSQKHQSNRVLCVAAHPDDEVLGLGATLALHASNCDEVVVIILSEGEAQKLHVEKSNERISSAEMASKEMGTADLIMLDLPDQELDSIPFIDVIKPIENIMKTFRPSVVYCHHGGDANTDHQIAFKATYAACRPMTETGNCVKTLLAFETPSSTDQAPQIPGYTFNPQHFVDVTPTWDKKIAALKCYQSEMVGGIHPRSFEYIESLARTRGGYSGFRLAEAFAVLRSRSTII